MSHGHDFLSTWFYRVWKEQNSQAIDEMFAGGEVRGLGQQTMVTVDDFKQFHAAMCHLLSDIEIKIDKSVEQNNWLSALCTVTAKSKASGKNISITGNVWVRIENNQIQEGYNHFDFIGLYAQLGLLPEDTFEQGLQGFKIA